MQAVVAAQDIGKLRSSPRNQVKRTTLGDPFSW